MGHLQFLETMVSLAQLGHAPWVSPLLLEDARHSVVDGPRVVCWFGYPDCFELVGMEEPLVLLHHSGLDQKVVNVHS